MERHKIIIDRLMGTPTYTRTKKCSNDKTHNRQPHCQQRLPNDVKRGTHKISTPMTFCPPKSTLLKAIRTIQSTTWPGLTTEAVQKYLPESCLATEKWHMKRQRKGIISTTDKKDALEQIETAR